MPISKIIHQTWKTQTIPGKWKDFQSQVQNIYKDWQYILWTDEMMEKFVQEKFPDFYTLWSAIPKMIMKADIFRYLLMYELGGMYLDLDYEMLRPYDFADKNVVLPQERSRSYGDKTDAIGNCILASEPNHLFWKDIIEYLTKNPPKVDSYVDVVDVTGPGLLTKIYYKNPERYNDICTPQRINFHPLPPHNRKDYALLVNDKNVYGIHHGWGSWKERLSRVYLKRKFHKIKKSVWTRMKRYGLSIGH